MTTEEKLQHFLDFCMEDVRTRSGKMLDDYETSLEKTFKEHQADARRRAEMEIRIQKENIKREVNKRLSIEQLNIKRKLNNKQEELKDMLFVELRDYLAQFMDSSAYHELLEKQIKAAKDFAGNDEMVVYMDPSDTGQISRLAFHHNVRIQPAEHSFLGGIIAVIPSKNILIDNSFVKKLDDARHNFSFALNFDALKNKKGGEDHGE